MGLRYLNKQIEQAFPSAKWGYTITCTTNVGNGNAWLAQISIDEEEKKFIVRPLKDAELSEATEWDGEQFVSVASYAMTTTGSLILAIRKGYAHVVNDRVQH